MSSQQVTSIRDEYKAQTRERILDAAIAALSEGDGTEMTIADVAARAGITERTIYRHFETRDELLKALWPKMQQMVRSTGFPKNAATLIDQPRKLFPEFDRHAGLVRASIYSPAGLEVRLKANAERTAAHLAIVKAAFPNLDDDAALRRAAVLQLINSGYAWEVMRQFWGLDGDQAGLAASEAIAFLLNQPQPTEQEKSS